MDRIGGLWRWLRTLFTRNRFERELESELKFHLEKAYQENLQQGLSEAEAERLARLSLGGIERTRSQVRETGTPFFFESVLHDLRFGLRRLLRRPGFTAIALLLLTLGIGATTTIFSIIKTTLLQPLPYDDPDRLCRLWQRNDDRGWSMMSFSESNYLDFVRLNRTFQQVGAYASTDGVLTGSGEPRQLTIGRASAGLFPLLGIEPVLGRHFLPEEDVISRSYVAVLLSHSLWRTAFGEDPGIVGKSITLSNIPCTVVGVLPPGEFWLEWFDLYVPLAPDPNGHRGNNIIWPVGRLRPGSTLEDAAAEWSANATRITAEHPEGNAITGVTFLPLEQWLIQDHVRQSLWILLGAVGFVLLIACANLANLLLARASGRRREIAITAALGAGRARIVRQMITESILLALLGGVLGVLLSFGAVGILTRIEVTDIPRLALVTVNAGVCAFTFGLSLLVGIVTGLIPALRVPHAKAHEILKEGSRSSGGRRQHRTSGLLLVVETAVSILLLIGAGLMVRSLAELREVDTGFAVENRLLFEVTLPPQTYGARDRRVRFFDEFIPRMEAMPAVTAAGAVSCAPLAGMTTDMGVYAEGRQPGPDESTLIAEWRYVSPEFFDAMGLTMLAGRTFSDTDIREDPNRVVISEALAQEIWEERDVIGRRLVLWANTDRIGTVIGVVSDMTERGQVHGPRLSVYLSYDWGLRNPVTFVVHTVEDPIPVVPEIRALLGDIDPDLPLANIRTMSDVVTGSLSAPRLNTGLLITFALLALVMACAGIYGVMGYLVSQRTAEMALRTTLGATGTDVVRLMIWQGMKFILAGVIIGLTAAFWLSRLMTNMLFDVPPVDPVTYVAVTFLLTAAALLATVLPARRISRIDPVTALRVE